MKRIFVPLTKVDAEQRLVYGVAAIEQLDKSGEIFDYESSKPLFQSWSEEFQKLSIPAVQVFGEDAKNYGNVREMHGKTAAGKLFAPIAFDDSAKTVEIVSKVTDDAAWKKVCDGVYTGYSIGGEYAKTWKDSVIKNAIRYTAKPHEVSLVDNPCMPGATFEIIKTTGTELRKFSTVELTAGDIPVAVAKACESLATGAPGAHAQAARVIKSAKVLGVDVSGFTKAYVQMFGGKLGKGMYDISDIASILCSLNYCRQSLQYEADYEGDGSEIPARLKALVETLSAILVDLVTEETSELTAEKFAINLFGEELHNVKKFFATHNATIAKMAASSDPEVAALGKGLQDIEAEVSPAGAPAVALVPVEKLTPVVLEKVVEDRFVKMETAQTETNEQIKNLLQVVTKFIGSQPAPPAVAVTTVAKTADVAGAAIPVVIDPKDPDAAFKAMKSVHASGPVLLK